ncbi:HAD family hydrolase [Paenibacillus sp. FA6]|uniref:HAD family hydrolase n=1 Tax=Paenibacillus sp. FA6 TaxID=3413029 RepID=UPI003F65E164
MTILTVHGQSQEVDAILFDKDGTLLDFMSLWGQWAEFMTTQIMERIHSLGVVAIEGLASKMLGLMLDADGKATSYDIQGPLSMGSVSETEGALAWQLYNAGLPWNESIQLIRQFAVSASEELERERPVLPLPGLIDFLGQCREYELPLAVVTADHAAEACKHLTWMGVEGHFEHIIGSDMVTEGKPSPEMVQLACVRLNVLPERVAMVGDTAGDMQAAKAAGVGLIIGIGSSGTLQHADVMISSYDEMMLIVPSL